MDVMRTFHLKSPTKVDLAIRLIARTAGSGAVTHRKDRINFADVYSIGGFEARIPEDMPATEVHGVLTDLARRFLAALEQPKRRRRFRTRQRSIGVGMRAFVVGVKLK